MPSKRQLAGGKPAPVDHILGMLDGECDEVATIFKTVIKAHLGRNGQDNPRDRQARIQKLIQDCVETHSRKDCGES